MTDLARTARLDVLVEGYVRPPHVAGTVSLVRDASAVRDLRNIVAQDRTTGNCGPLTSSTKEALEHVKWIGVMLLAAFMGLQAFLQGSQRVSGTRK